MHANTQSYFKQKIRRNVIGNRRENVALFDKPTHVSTVFKYCYVLSILTTCVTLTHSSYQHTASSCLVTVVIRVPRYL